MSRQVIYKCDKCGSEQATADQFWTVGVKASPLNALGNGPERSEGPR